MTEQAAGPWQASTVYALRHHFNLRIERDRKRRQAKGLKGGSNDSKFSVILGEVL
jgi:hypothetical protein